MYKTYAAVLGTVALAVAGCGDEKKLNLGSASTLTKAEFIAKADDTCVAAKKARQPFKDRFDALPASAGLKDVLPILKGGDAETRKGLANLRALPSPSEDKATLDSYYAARDAAISVADQAEAAATANDAAKFRQLAAGNTGLKAKQKKLAKDYGFKHCAT